MKRLGAIFLCLATAAAARDYSPEIRKAVRYFQTTKRKLSPGAIVTLDFLVRNYPVKIDITAARRELVARATPAQRVMLRVLDSRIMVPELDIRVIKGARGILPAALYCDVYPLPWNFFSHIRELAEERGGFVATWSMFALAMIEWQNCKYDNDARLALQALLVEKSRDLVRQETTGTELWISAVQSLILAERRDLIEPQLPKLAAAQAADGSWQGDDNLTAKALWVFLSAAESREALRRKKLIGVSAR